MAADLAILYDGDLKPIRMMIAALCFAASVGCLKVYPEDCP